MPNFKVILTCVLFGALATGGCDADGRAGDGRPVVVTTFTVLQDMAREVAGEHLVVESITKVGAEIHGYEPTPRDVAKAARAELVIDNGLGLEAWFAQFIEPAEVEHVVVSEGVEVLDITGESGAGKSNPHAWMSPVNAEIYVENLVRAFSRLAPEHASDFEANGAAYRKDLRDLHDDVTRALASVPEPQRVLVTCEGAFSYLARDLGLTEQYIWPVNAEQQATAQQVASTIRFVRERDVPAVFCESTVSDAAMRQVVGATDAEFGGTLYVDSLSDADGPVPSYVELLRHDTEIIVAGLSGGNDG